MSRPVLRSTIGVLRHQQVGLAVQPARVAAYATAATTTTTTAPKKRGRPRKTEIAPAAASPIATSSTKSAKSTKAAPAQQASSPDAFAPPPPPPAALDASATTKMHAATEEEPSLATVPEISRTPSPEPAVAETPQLDATTAPVHEAAPVSATPEAIEQKEATPENQRTPNKASLAPFLREHPWAMSLFLGFTRLLGYSSPRQRAARRVLALYRSVCVPRADADLAFWRDECHLPPTFQSWFTITNLHVWMLTTRLRALPSPTGELYVQALVDHFFIDIEDRIRAVLRPTTTPPTPISPLSSPSAPPPVPTSQTAFYPDPRGMASPSADGKKPASAPERLVSQQLKILREQWAGLGLSLDLALVQGDAEMAGAMWRNFLGARGARGIAYPGEDSGSDADSRRPSSLSTGSINAASAVLTGTPAGAAPSAHYRRSINLVGSSDKAVRLIDAAPGGLDAAERSDDGSGVYDHSPEEANEYVQYPKRMATLVEYVRREVYRLERVPDELITGPASIIQDDGPIVIGSSVQFGPVKA